MDLDRLELFLNSIEKISKLTRVKDDKGHHFDFIYGDSLEAEVAVVTKVSGWAYLTIKTICTPKLFKRGKIIKALNEWAYKIVSPYDKEGLGLVALEASEIGYMISLTDEMVPAIEQLLEEFEPVFLPLIKEYLK